LLDIGPGGDFIGVFKGVFLDTFSSSSEDITRVAGPVPVPAPDCGIFEK
jgi:hypothetical protein